VTRPVHDASAGQTGVVIGLDAGDGVLLALREAQLSERIAAGCRRNADRLAPAMPWAREASGLTDEAVAAYDRQTLHRLADGTALDLAIVRDDKVLGAVNTVIDEEGTAELGWWVDADVEGTGLAVRAASTLAEHLVGRRGVARLAARTPPGDRRSKALAHRLGLVDHGVVSGVRAHALPASVWREQHPATGVELALAVDDELEVVLTEPRFVPAMHTMTVANHDRLRRWESWAQDQPDPQQTAAWWHDRMSAFARGEAYPLAPRVRGAAEPALLGSLGATIEPALSIATVGYWLDEAAVGSGIGRRSVDALVRMLMHERGIRHVGLTTAVDNTRSRALAERCGFRFDRLLPSSQRIAGIEIDCVAYVHRDSSS
jgi:ribosomal-protein-serine acetyltransferase